MFILAGGLMHSVFAQIGGRHIYDFLNISPSARIVSLGGINVSTLDDDVNFGSQNPALVTDSMHKHLSLSFSNHLTDINYGYASYSHTFEKLGSFHSGIQFANYGKFKGADEFGNLTGEFSAADFVWITGYSRAYRRFRYGANLKVINSTLGPGFTSIGLAMDLGGSYKSKSELFTAGLVFKNIGTQITTYTGTGIREPLPFEIVAGISNKLRYMPLRFSITAVQIEHPDLIYEDPDALPQIDLAGNEIKPPNRTADRIFRHFVFSTEFLLGKSLRLRAGYNHLRRQELRSENRAGFTGFSLGAGLRVSRFALDYGFSSYGLNSVFQTHQFSISYNFQKTREKKAEDNK